MAQSDRPSRLVVTCCCGFEMLVSADDLGKTGSCAKCKSELSVTNDNTRPYLQDTDRTSSGSPCLMWAVGLFIGFCLWVGAWKFIMFPLNSWVKSFALGGDAGILGLIIALIVGVLNLLMIAPIVILGGYAVAAILKKGENTLFGDPEKMAPMTPEQMRGAQRAKFLMDEAERREGR